MTEENGAAERDEAALRTVGRDVPRRDGLDKVTGAVRYVADIRFAESFLHGATVRAGAPRGRVREIRFRDGVPWDEFIVVLPKDVPGENHVMPDDKLQPFLATEVRHLGEPVALIAHPDETLLSRALALIEVVIDEQPAIFSIEESLAGGEIQHGVDNVFRRCQIRRGDPETVWAQAALVFEETYRTGAQDPLDLETNGVLAKAVPGETVTIWGSMQNPFAVRRALAPLFALSTERVRVVQTETGGAFGGREEYPSLLAGHAALLSWKAGGRLVRMVHDRREDMLATPKRHPSRTTVKAGFAADGRLLALAIDYVLDGGAYPTLSPDVLAGGVLHSFGPYRCDHVRVDGRVVFTNSPPYGAFKGGGVPQSVFAMETHMNRAAEKLGLDPAEIRRVNLLRQGDAMPTGQVMNENLDLPGLMDRALALSDFERKRREYAVFNRAGGNLRRGMGLSLFFHGSGYAGAGESAVRVRLDKRGVVEVLMPSADCGQGVATTIAQVVAEAFGVPVGFVEVHRLDTALVPDNGPVATAHATMIVGRLVQEAAAELRARFLAESGLEPVFGADDFRRAVRPLLQKHGEFAVTRQFTPPADFSWDEGRFRGEAYRGFAWSCDVADVEVDLATCTVAVRSFVSVVECGRLINPLIARGQIEGGSAQGIGWALSEHVIRERGAMKNNRLAGYALPLSADLPRIDVEFVEFRPYVNEGPYQAKDSVELPCAGPAPAIVAAVAQALGFFIAEVPLLPETILAAIESHG